MKKRNFYFILISILVFTQPVIAENILILSEKMNGILINERGLEDFKVVHSEDESGHPIEFIELKKDNILNINEAFWFRFRVKNPTNHNIKWRIENRHTGIDLWEFQNNRFELVNKVNGKVKYEKPSIKLSHLFFEVDSPPGESFLYFKASSREPVNVLFRAWDKVSFNSYVQDRSFLFYFILGALVMITAYNIALFFFIRERSYLLHVLYLIGFACLLFTRTGWSLEYLWPNSPYWNSVVTPVALILSFVAIQASTMHLMKTWWLHLLIYHIQRFFIFIGFAIAFLALFIPPPYTLYIAILYMFVSVLLLLAVWIRALKKNNRSSKYFITAWGIFLFSFILFFISTYQPFFTKVMTVRLFQLSFVVKVFLLSVGVASRITKLRLDLEKKIKKLDISNFQLAESEKKFRYLMNAAKDIIFILDQDFKFKVVSDNLYKRLGYKPDVIIGKKIFDLIYREEKGKLIEPESYRDIAKEKGLELLGKKKKIEFQVPLISGRNSEPVLMNIHLDYVKTSSETIDIFGNARPLKDDQLSKYLIAEKLTFSVDNLLSNADILSERISRELKNKVPQAQIMQIRLAIREILINAIEHGNLEISFEEKTQEVDQGNYLKFLEERRKKDNYKDRRVNVEYTISSLQIAIRITDEGPGFDHKKMVKGASEKANQEGLSHGRGIIITYNVFDKMNYNKKGNQVTLIKYLNKN